jgi:hypothetical protein
MAINLVQFITATAGSVSSLSAVFSSAVTAGNSIIMWSGVFKALGGVGFSTAVDNVNNAGFTGRIFSTMVNASDSRATLFCHEKLNISSGAAGSTYRVEVRCNEAANNISLCATEFDGGTYTFGSTTSSNGTSTGPSGAALTASSNPAVRISGAINNSTGQFRSTVVGSGNWIATVDPTNANQVLNVIRSTQSSLTQITKHGMTASTRWLAGCVLYTAAAGGAAARPFVDGFPLFGCV